MQSVHVSRVITAAPEVVYGFVADPVNLPRWAAGLAQGEVLPDGDGFVVDAPMGRVRVTFVPPNPFGIVDHDVRLPSGLVVYNPVRIIAHPRGSEVIFTVRQLDLSDEELERDVAAVAADLDTLRALIERTS